MDTIMSEQRTALAELMKEKFTVLIEKMSTFQERDSGWSLIEIRYLEVNVNKYEALRGSTYIPLPKEVQLKKACINVQNKDQFCFKWAVISACNQVSDNANLPFKYNFTNISDSIITLENKKILNFSNLVFPLKVKDVSVFEKNNPYISINVFGLEDNKIVGPFYITEKEKDNHINLLLLIDEHDGNCAHYCWIKNMSRLIRSQILNNKRQFFFCNMCIVHFNSVESLEKHKDKCSRVVTYLPASNNNILSFKNF